MRAPSRMPFRGGYTNTRCPPGIICLTPTLIGFSFLVIVCILGTFLWIKNELPVSLPMQPVQPMQPMQPMQPVQQVVSVDGGDDRFTRAPRPERYWMSPLEIPARGAIASIPIGIPTQGLPEQFQSFGMINLSDGTTLPLYGRRTAGRSDRFNYYTRTDSYNPVQLPISYHRRDCMDSVGCDELFNGETVKLKGVGTEGNVTLYQYDGPTYFPGLV